MSTNVVAPGPRQLKVIADVASHRSPLEEPAHVHPDVVALDLDQGRALLGLELGQAGRRRAEVRHAPER